MLGTAARSRASAAATAKSRAGSAAEFQTKKRPMCPGRGDGGGNQPSPARRSDQSLSARRSNEPGRALEVLKVVDGIWVLLRSYLVVHARDMFVLDDTNKFGSGLGSDGQPKHFGGAGGGGGGAAGSAMPQSAFPLPHRAVGGPTPPRVTNFGSGDARGGGGVAGGTLPSSALPRSHPAVGGSSAPSVSAGGAREGAPSRGSEACKATDARVAAGVNVQEEQGARVDAVAFRGGGACMAMEARLVGRESMPAKQQQQQCPTPSNDPPGVAGVNMAGRGQDSAASVRENPRNRTGAEGIRIHSLSVSEALVVRLARNGVAAAGARSGGGGTRGGTRGGGDGGGSGGGPRVASSHERESVTVTGLLREVGFRSASTTFGGGAGGGGGARPGHEVAAGKRDRMGGVDMFDVLSRTKMQLCLTLEEGVDRVCVYLGLRRECWPAGMIPGYSTVQVRLNSF